jgi:hypothetical protein
MDHSISISINTKKKLLFNRNDITLSTKEKHGQIDEDGENE